MIEINVLQVLSGIPGAAEFNYFFTLVSYFGIMAVIVGMLTNILRR